MTNLPFINTADRLIHGSLLKCTDGRWTSEGVDVTGSQLLALHCVKALQRWDSQKPIETIVESPDTALPCVDDLNAAIPKARGSLGSTVSRNHRGNSTSSFTYWTFPTRACGLSPIPRWAPGLLTSD